MHHAGDRQVHTLTIASEAAGDVSILEIEEITLIKAARAAEGITADQHATTAEIGRFKHLLVVLIRHHVPAVITLQPVGLEPSRQKTATEQTQHGWVLLT